MTSVGESELILIRHALAQTGGRLTGRRDVPLLLSDEPALARIAASLSEVGPVVTSPALRCCQTAELLFPGRDITRDARLWEQDFGAYEGLLPEETPDLGQLDRAALAEVTAPNGESFTAMVDRVSPALNDLSERAVTDGPVVVVAHAGTVRAGLALALNDVPIALAFEIDPLSVTRLRCLPGTFSVLCVNVVL